MRPPWASSERSRSRNSSQISLFVCVLFARRCFFDQRRAIFLSNDSASVARRGQNSKEPAIRSKFRQCPLKRFQHCEVVSQVTARRYGCINYGRALPPLQRCIASRDEFHGWGSKNPNACGWWQLAWPWPALTTVYCGRGKRAGDKNPN